MHQHHTVSGPVSKSAFVNDQRVEASAKSPARFEIGVSITEQSMAAHIVTAVIHQEEDPFVAECLEVGTVSQGPSVDEAVANLREATELYLEKLGPPHLARSLITTFDVALSA